MHFKILHSQSQLYNVNVLLDQLDLDKKYDKDDILFSYAYSKWGDKMFSHLDGDFSFAIYDTDNKCYFAARDPLGIKSLYYTKTEEGYIFSSHIDALLTLPEVHKKPKLSSMRTMLYERTLDYRDTMYEDIYRLPPGHFMTIKEEKEHIERYWYPEQVKINYAITEDEAAKKIKTLLIKAIDKRVSNLKETAFEVSGGLDSSSVVSLLAQKNGGVGVDSYSMEFHGLPCDESRYVDSILDKYPLYHQKVSAGQLDYQKAYALEQLYAMGSHWPITLTFAMSLPMLEKMQMDGKKAVLTGQGGDELFTGTPYVLYDLFERFEFLTLYRYLKEYPKPWRMIKSYMLKPLLGEKTFMLIKKLFGKKEKNAFQRKHSNIKNISDIAGVKNPAHKSDLDMLTMAGHSSTLDGNLFHATEEHFGIEFRHPFFDLELVQFALSLPPEMKYKKRTIKWILRKAMDGILPDKIRERKDKAEFSEVIMQQVDAIDLSTLLDDPYIVKQGLIEQSLIDEHRAEYENKTVKHIVFLWTIINVEYWYRYNFEDN